MKTNIRMIGSLAAGVTLVFSQVPNTHAALTDAQRAQIEESIRQLEEATSNMMAQAQAAAASRPAPASAQIATQQAALQAALDKVESNRLAILPFLHNPVKMPDGTLAASFGDLLDARAMAASSNAEAIIRQQQAELDDALAFGATNGCPPRLCFQAVQSLAL